MPGIPHTTRTAARVTPRMAVLIAAVMFAVPLTATATPAHASGGPDESPTGADSITAGQASWEFSAMAYYYFYPDDADEILPIIYADHGSLHLEGRYNYEDTRSGSIFAGWAFSLGEDLFLEATPMAGVVFGNISGLAPGLELTLGYRWLELYSESEYVFDSGGRENDFLYIWSELGAAPWQPLTLGMVAQQLKEHDTSLDSQLGFVAGLEISRFELGFYYLNPFEDDHFVVFAFTAYF